MRSLKFRLYGDLAILAAAIVFVGVGVWQVGNMMGRALGLTLFAIRAVRAEEARLEARLEENNNQAPAGAESAPVAVGEA